VPWVSDAHVLEQASVGSHNVVTLSSYRLSVSLSKERSVVSELAPLMEVRQHVFKIMGTTKQVRYLLVAVALGGGNVGIQISKQNRMLMGEPLQGSG
jgi:hypothetical protein